MKANKVSRDNSNTWRNWRKTSIRVFVGLNMLIVVGFYAATSNFHGGLSHLEDSGTSNTGSSDHGRLGKDAALKVALQSTLMSAATRA